MIRSRSSSLGVSLLSLGLILSSAAISSGAITVQELFDGIAGPPPGTDSPLGGKGDTATSIGLTGTWVANSGTTIYTASNFNTGAGLPGLPSNAGANGGVWNNGTSYSTTIYDTRPLATAINFGVTQTVYFSVLLNNSGDTSMGIGLAAGPGGSAEFVGAGLTWNNARALATNVNDSGNAAYIAYGTLDSNSGPYGVRNHEAAGSINGAALIVGRITINSTGADLIDIKRYAAGDTIASDPSLVSWSASDSFTSSMLATNLLLWNNGISGNGVGEVDAIRFGTTWGDVTGTVPSIPLITASIMSKKLAESLDRLVLDVKYGSGAFMQTREHAQELADAMTAAGKEMQVDTHAVLNPMDEPLGCAVGNVLEVIEALECLSGGGPGDLRELVLDLSEKISPASRTELEALLDDGSARRKFEDMVRAQGGDPDDLNRLGEIHRAPIVVDFPSPATGILRRFDAGAIGQAALQLGAGRAQTGDTIDHAVGFDRIVKCGQPVHHGRPLCRIQARHRADADMALAMLESAVAVEE